MTELNRLTLPKLKPSAEPKVSCVESVTKALKARELPLKKEADAERTRRQREVERRKKHLASVFDRAESIWPEFDPLMVLLKAA